MTEVMFIMVAGIVVGLCVGGVMVWCVYRSIIKRLTQQFDRLQQEFNASSQREQDMRVVMAQLTERANGLTARLNEYMVLEQENCNLQEKLTQMTAHAAQIESSAAAAHKQADMLRQQLEQLQIEQAETRHALMNKQARVAELETAITHNQQHNAEKIQQLEDAKVQLSNTFQTIAETVLEKKTKQVAETSQMQLAGLLNPLRDKIDAFQKKVDEAYQQESRDRISLAQKVDMLAALNREIGEDAKNLAKALKGDSKTQGIWGEFVLERLLTLAGLVNGREYHTQVSETLDGKTFRPDVVLHMPPQDRRLIIDAKVSLTAFERYMHEEDDKLKEEALKQHIHSVRQHIAELSKKDYTKLYPKETVDYVIMFVAVEPAFLTALDHAPDLYQEAWQKNVLMVCPSTLLFVLRMVDLLWRQQNQSNNAAAIVEAANNMYDKCCGFVKNFESIGVEIGRLQKAYDTAYGQLAAGRGNLLKRMGDLQRQKLIDSKKTLQIQGVSDEQPDE